MKTASTASNVASFVASIIVGILVVCLGNEFARGNTVTLQLLVTAFSVMTGILLAIIAISGDPSILYSGNHRVARAHQKQLDVTLRRYEYLFYCYLTTIALAIISTALDRVDGLSTVAHWIERVTLGIGACALFWSFKLPHAVVRTHASRLRSEVDRRKEQAKNDDWPDKSNEMKE